MIIFSLFLFLANITKTTERMPTTIKSNNDSLDRRNLKNCIKSFSLSLFSSFSSLYQMFPSLLLLILMTSFVFRISGMYKYLMMIFQMN